MNTESITVFSKKIIKRCTERVDDLAVVIYKDSEDAVSRRAPPVAVDVGIYRVQYNFRLG